MWCSQGGVSQHAWGSCRQIGTVLDVTEQLASERALRESKGRTGADSRTVHCRFFAIDAEHTVVVWNPACERTFGPSAGEMISRRELWRAFYATPRPVMADIVLDGGDKTDVARYTRALPALGVQSGGVRGGGLFPASWRKRTLAVFHRLAAARMADGSARSKPWSISPNANVPSRKRELNERLELRVEQRTADLQKANEDLQLAMKQTGTDGKAGVAGQPGCRRRPRTQYAARQRADRCQRAATGPWNSPR